MSETASLGAAAPAATIAQRVWRRMVRADLVRSGETVVVALSGGPDSSALLGLLVAIDRQQGLDLCLHAAHFDHGLRDGSARDADLAERVAATLGVPFVVERGRLGRAPFPGGLEAAAREARYDFLARTAVRLRAQAVATAHHLDDHLETILLGLARGSLALARGIPIRRELGGAPGVRVIRPVLGVRRQDLRAAASSFGLEVAFDPTNDDTGRLRNAFRRLVLPALRGERAGFERRLLRIARRARGEVEGRLGTQGAVPPHCASLTRALRARPLPEGEVGEGKPAARGFASFRPPLPPGEGCGEPQASRRVRETAGGGAKPAGAFDPVPLTVPGTTPIPALGLAVEASLPESVRRDFRSSPPPPHEAWLDAARLAGPLYVRTRRPGDRLRPLGASGRRKVQDILVDRKIPASARDAIPLIVAGSPDGPIVWLGGVAIAEEARISEHTRHAVRLVISEA